MWGNLAQPPDVEKAGSFDPAFLRFQYAKSLANDFSFVEEVSDFAFR